MLVNNLQIVHFVWNTMFFGTFRNHHWYTNAPKHVEITDFGAVFKTLDTDIIAYWQLFVPEKGSENSEIMYFTLHFSWKSLIFKHSDFSGLWPAIFGTISSEIYDVYQNKSFLHPGFPHFWHPLIPIVTQKNMKRWDFKKSLFWISLTPSWAEVG